MIEAILIVASAVAGAVVFRLRGGWLGAWPLDRQVTLAAWSGILTAPLWLVAPWWAVAAAFVATFGATSTGHGSGIDGGRHPDDDPDELWRYLWAPRDAPLDHAKFMAVRGALMSLGPGATAVCWLGWAWAPLLLCGALMAPAYAIGWRYAWATEGNKRLLPVGAEMGEWLTGGSVAAVCALPWMVALP